VTVISPILTLRTGSHRAFLPATPGPAYNSPFAYLSLASWPRPGTQADGRRLGRRAL